MERELTETAFVGERLLYAEIIQRAALDIAQDLSSPRHWVDQQNAEAWIRSKAEHETSFLECCEVCGYDPDFMREKILAKAIKDRPVKRTTIWRRRWADKKRRQA